MCMYISILCVYIHNIYIYMHRFTYFLGRREFTEFEKFDFKNFALALPASKKYAQVRLRKPNFVFDVTLTHDPLQVRQSKLLSDNETLLQARATWYITCCQETLVRKKNMDPNHVHWSSTHIHTLTHNT